MMLKLLELKEYIKQIGDKHGVSVKIFAKLIAAFTIFSLFCTKFGYNAKLNNIAVTLLLSVVAAVTPDMVFAILVCIVSLLNVYPVSLILAIVLLVIYIIVYLLYLRFVPTQIFVVIAVPFLCIMNIPYVIPLLCGLLLTPVTMISSSIGLAIYYVFKAISATQGMTEGASIANTVNFFGMLLDNIKTNKFMMFSIVIFAVVILLTYIIRRQKFNHSSYAAIIISSVLLLVAFVLATSLIENSGDVLSVVGGVIVSAIIVVIVQFFRISLDYSGTKNIQFEDDEYYYYVKAVPKLSVAAPDVQVKRIHAQVPSNSTTNLKEAIDRLSAESENLEKSVTEEDQ
ncbi:MAG: hypothetical protein SOW12_01125 [Lachnospiraceae bacterium]|nr:hypothetical protein [Lachnoclostridium sp.]MDD7522355.1 hypothetical protein [Lachnoclostridium sp.]MDY2598521.1 hypothetical protein [Lachnospiraceae bacterium]